ncbi:MAG: arsenic resistance N-acetyltransferase ArsN2 [Chitinophagaceae bacterium]|jgi:N-acetylglutamate synthase-like GNAT family acetyltransferase|nr:arsenic resistance N-acetyltransferase ArsN2 [Chitinophagaceae bacterium]
MKRFHVNVRVKDLGESIGFYSSIFNAAPTVQKSDYAKWMLEDPRINFAISLRPDAPGIEHLGIQAESEQELQEVYANLRNAKASLLEEGKCACCYAKSEKAWITDPQGVSWEAFYTFGETTVYGEGIHSRQNKDFFREAKSEYEQAKVREMLDAVKLPVDDISGNTKLFMLTRKGRVIGTGGLEMLGEVALMRSVSTDENLRGQGLGKYVVDELEQAASRAGVKSLYLVTTSAREFFARLGYEESDRKKLPDVVKQQRQLKDVCPASAVVMQKSLGRQRSSGD